MKPALSTVVIQWLMLLFVSVFASTGTYYAILIRANFEQWTDPSATLETTENAGLSRDFLFAVALVVTGMMFLIAMAASYTWWHRIKSADTFSRRPQILLALALLLTAVSLGAIVANNKLNQLAQQIIKDYNNEIAARTAQLNSAPQQCVLELENQWKSWAQPPCYSCLLELPDNDYNPIYTETLLQSEYGPQGFSSWTYLTKMVPLDDIVCASQTSVVAINAFEIFAATNLSANISISQWPCNIPTYMTTDSPNEVALAVYATVLNAWVPMVTEIGPVQEPTTEHCVHVTGSASRRFYLPPICNFDPEPWSNSFHNCISQDLLQFNEQWLATVATLRANLANVAEPPPRVMHYPVWDVNFLLGSGLVVFGVVAIMTCRQCRIRKSLPTEERAHFIQR